MKLKELSKKDPWGYVHYEETENNYLKKEGLVRSEIRVSFLKHMKNFYEQHADMYDTRIRMLQKSIRKDGVHDQENKDC